MGINDELDEILSRINWINEQELSKFFTGTIIAAYDFINKWWNISYRNEKFEFCNIGIRSGGGLEIKGKEINELLYKIKEKLTNLVQTDDKNSTAKGIVTAALRNLGETTTAVHLEIQNIKWNHDLKLYKRLNELLVLLGNGKGLFSQLFMQSMVVSDNIRPFPTSEFTAAKLLELLPEAITSDNINLYLYKLKNGELTERKKYQKIQKKFRKITGLNFEIKEKAISRKVSLEKYVAIHALEHPESIGSIMDGVIVDPDRYELINFINIEVEPPNSSRAISIEYSGAGIWEVLYFSALSESKGKIYLLDEPGANVHPTLQKLIFENLIRKNIKPSREKSETLNGNGGNQYSRPQMFLITHSPYLIDLENIENISRFKMDNERNTKRTHVQRDMIPDTSKEILSRSKAAAECLFSKAVILVEGPSEYIALPIWYKKYFKILLEDESIQLIWMGGKGNFQHYLAFLKQFEIPWFFLTDGDSIGDKNGKCQVGNKINKYISESNVIDWKPLDFKERKKKLENFNIFTFSTTAKDDFESSLGITCSGTSKPEAALKFAMDNECPSVVEDFFDKLKVN